MKKAFIYPLLIGVLLLLSLTIFFSFSQEKSKIAYIDNAVLFSDFLMTQEMKATGSKIIREQQEKLDSLHLIFEEKDSIPLKADREILIQEMKKLQELKQQYMDEAIQQVWGRLNDYIQLYGEENEFMLILGAQGNGNVMYAQETINITEEVLKFANSKYQGN